jgi:hypothetical protein
VTNRRLSAFLDALAAGRRPGRYRADPEDLAILRTAINLRAARPGDSKPNEQFVSDLYQKLSNQAASPVAPDAPGPVTTRRRRTAVATVAAAAVLVGGTVATTEAFRQTASTPTIAQAPHGKVLRTGTFATPDSQILGQIVAYHGHPSWVFLNVAVPNYEGPIVCKLQVADGSTVAFGTFEVHHGVGQFSKILQVDVDRLRGAKLVSPTGSTVASATFS